jgi:hypothetical protein
VALARFGKGCDKIFDLFEQNGSTLVILNRAALVRMLVSF